MSRRLTAEAQEDRDDFDREFGDRGCTCFISPPCSHCTHPGNPLCQEQDDCYEPDVPLTGSRNQREGKYCGRIVVDLPSTRMQGLVGRKHHRSHVIYDQLGYPWWAK